MASIAIPPAYAIFTSAGDSPAPSSSQQPPAQPLSKASTSPPQSLIPVPPVYALFPPAKPKTLSSISSHCRLPTPPASPPCSEPHPTLPHRSHDPAKNQKRSDPFQFGSRYLEATDDVFEFNAWDHVETSPEYKEYAEAQFSKQRSSPVSDYNKLRFNSNPAKWWTQFYKNNNANFFKDRKWLFQEFPVLRKATAEDGGEVRLLEVGAGAGNTAFPILAQNRNPGLRIHACDFSAQAVELIRTHPQYDAPPVGSISADVWDISSTDSHLPPNVEAGSVDIVLMIFIFSALSPNQWEAAVRNVSHLLKPGGKVLLRDYGRGDLAQVRFRAGRYMDENFYARGDGTRVYFFEEQELRGIWEKEGLQVQVLGVDRRLLVNRQRKLKMYRCWLQGVFQKACSGLTEQSTETHIERSHASYTDST